MEEVGKWRGSGVEGGSIVKVDLLNYEIIMNNTCNTYIDQPDWVYMGANVV